MKIFYSNKSFWLLSSFSWAHGSLGRLSTLFLEKPVMSDGQFTSTIRPGPEMPPGIRWPELAGSVPTYRVSPDMGTELGVVPHTYTHTLFGFTTTETSYSYMLFHLG